MEKTFGGVIGNQFALRTAAEQPGTLLGTAADSKVNNATKNDAIVIENNSNKINDANNNNTTTNSNDIVLSGAAGASLAAASRVEPTPLPTTFSGFEGPEKKLEIDFKRVKSAAGGAGAITEFAEYPMLPSDERSGLRALSRAKLDYICSLVNCTIMSKTSNEYFDAYVLSESSLFVYPQKVLMKTCGTTTLLRCLSTVVQYAAECDLEVEALFYSRQKFIFPDKQKFPHTSFEHEVAHLHEIFPSGQSYCMGDRSGDHWFLFHVDLSLGKPEHARQDRSVEIMMEKLDCDIMRLFFQSTYADHATAKAAIAAADPALLVRRAKPVSPMLEAGVDAIVARLPPGIGRSVSGEHLAVVGAPKFDVVLVGDAPSPTTATLDDQWRDGVPLDVDDAIAHGDTIAAARAAIRRLLPLHELFPGLVCDDHVFSPCGYSVNGLVGPTHVTMHVTPEPTHSFVSFDTNCPSGDVASFMAFVTRRLRPGRASLSVLSDVCAPQLFECRRARPLVLPFYRQKSRTTYELFNADGCMPYDVVFSTFGRVCDVVAV